MCVCVYEIGILPKCRMCLKTHVDSSPHVSNSMSFDLNHTCVGTRATRHVSVCVYKQCRFTKYGILDYCVLCRKCLDFKLRNLTCDYVICNSSLLLLLVLLFFCSNPTAFWSLRMHFRLNYRKTNNSIPLFATELVGCIFTKTETFHTNVE